MFLLHDHTRRLLCRAGFFFGCVVPTLAVIAWCAARHSSSRATECERDLANKLGVLAKIAEVEYPRPGVVLYRGVELAEPEASEPFFKARVVEAGFNQETFVLVASQPEIRGAQWPAVWELLARRLRKQTSDAEIPLRFVAAELTLHGEKQAQTFTELRAELSPTENGSAMLVNFRLAGVEMLDPAKIRIERDRRATPPVTHVELHTGGGAIPCEILAILLGMKSDSLGTKATFRGSLWAKEAASGCEGELSGQLTSLDLNRLVTNQFPHHLSGLANVAIQKAVVKQGKLVEAEGSFNAGPGVVGQSLLAALFDHLHWMPGRLAAESAELNPYEQIAFTFVLSQRGWVFGGQCRDGLPGAMIETRSGPLLLEPKEQPQPVLNLIKALVPAKEVQVPASWESRWLLQHLPVPQLVEPGDAATSTKSSAKLRVKRTAD